MADASEMAAEAGLGGEAPPRAAEEASIAATATTSRTTPAPASTPSTASVTSTRARRAVDEWWPRIAMLWPSSGDAIPAHERESDSPDSSSSSSSSSAVPFSQRDGGFNPSLVYGEVDAGALADVLAVAAAAYAPPTPSPSSPSSPSSSSSTTSSDSAIPVFYDIGSGLGKAVAAAALSGLFATSRGIELVEDLHREAERLATRWQAAIPAEARCAVELIHGDLRTTDWSCPEGGVVFAHSTCFDIRLMEEMSRIAERMRPGSILITTTNPVVSKLFERVHSASYAMSWGTCTVHVYRRLRLGRWVAGVLGRR